jgi:hypothetical protein
MKAFQDNTTSLKSKHIPKINEEVMTSQRSLELSLTIKTGVDGY